MTLAHQTIVQQPHEHQPLEQRRILATAVPGPRSQALHARRMLAVPRAVPAVLPVYIERAEGSILRDIDGNQLIDFGSGIAVAALGHAVPEINAAAARQMADFTHTCFAITPYEEYVELAEILNALTPGSFDKRTALSSSGSEAVENAIKIARRHTGRSAIVAFDHGYHGRTNLALALTSKATPYKQGFGPFAGDIHHVPMAYPYRWPGGASHCLDQAFDGFVDQIHTRIGETTVAAVIMEPILGEAGFIVPPPGFIARVAEWCGLHGIVFIADEVQTGFCRTGDWFACEHEDVAPDLIVTGKAIAGGLPLAAVTGRAEIMESVQIGGLGGTYAGNPVACAAALANIALMQAIDANGRARAIGTILRDRLGAMAAKWDVIGEVRGRGAMIAIELVIGGGEINPHPELAAAVVRACHAAGLVTMTTGMHRNSLRFLPPLTISDALLHEGLDILEQAFITAH